MICMRDRSRCLRHGISAVDTGDPLGHGESKRTVVA
jgi:hypothetical protein